MKQDFTEHHKITRTKLEGVVVLEPAVIADDRGKIVPLFDARSMDRGILRGCDFLIDRRFTSESGALKINITTSRYDVLRGIHVSPNTGKMFACLDGIVDFAVVDCRPGGTFGEWELLTLSSAKIQLVTVPPMFGVAHWVASQRATMLYLWSGPYDGEEQLTFRYDDPRFGIKWPTSHKPILSERDKCEDDHIRQEKSAEGR